MRKIFLGTRCACSLSIALHHAATSPGSCNILQVIIKEVIFLESSQTLTD
jgi:hypothetical protein